MFNMRHRRPSQQKQAQISTCEPVDPCEDKLVAQVYMRTSELDIKLHF